MLTNERKELKDFCYGRHCTDCMVAINNPEHNCGRGTHFLSKNPDGSYAMSDDEILEAYKHAFNKPVFNSVSRPSHYNQGNIECIDAMVAAFGAEQVATFCHINAFKYIWRMEHKNGCEDTDKAIWYLNKYKELKGIG